MGKMQIITLVFWILIAASCAGFGFLRYVKCNPEEIARSVSENESSAVHLPQKRLSVYQRHK